MTGVKDYNEEARKLLSEWKKERYAFGVNCAKKVGDFAKKEGKSCMLIVSGLDTIEEKKWKKSLVDEIKSSLREKKVSIVDIINGARANAPREDVYRIANQIGKRRADSIVAVGGGSTIDAVKASMVLATLDPDDVEVYFGANLVTG